MVGIILKLKNRKSAFLVVVSAILYYLLIFWLVNKLNLSKTTINEFIAPFGFKGIFLTAFLQFSISLTPFPYTLVMLPSLVLYGPFIGSLTSMTGIVLASAVHYNIAKRISRKFIFKRFPTTKRLIGQFSNDIKLEKLIIYNVFSFISFDVIAYLAGMGGVGFLKFIIASACALIPIIVHNILISIGLLTKDPVKLALIWLLTIVSVIITIYFAKIFNKRFDILKV